MKKQLSITYFCVCERVLACVGIGVDVGAVALACASASVALLTQDATRRNFTICGVCLQYF
jgi:hypothetical protein